MRDHTDDPEVFIDNAFLKPPPSLLANQHVSTGLGNLLFGKKSQGDSKILNLSDFAKYVFLSYHKRYYSDKEENRKKLRDELIDVVINLIVHLQETVDYETITKHILRFHLEEVILFENLIPE